MIIVHGEMRCGTTWVATMLSRIGDLSVVHEPCNPKWYEADWIPDPQTPKMFLKAWTDEVREFFTGACDLWWRHPWHNAETTPGMSERVREVFSYTEKAYPGVQIQKHMLFPYFREMRAVWPDCKIVYVRRRLESWLSAVWRTETVRNMILYGRWGCGRPWDRLSEQIASDIGADEPLRRKLLTLAAYHKIQTSFREELLRREIGDDFLGVDYEQLTGSYEIELPRLFAYCGIAVPGPVELCALAQPVQRERMDQDVIRAVHEIGEALPSAARRRPTCT